jgi:hypothetical protein
MTTTTTERPSQMPRPLGKALIIGGAAIAFAGTLSHLYKGESFTYWTYQRRWDILTALLLVGAVALAILSLIRAQGALNLPLVIVSLISGGNFLSGIVETTSQAGAGVYLMGVGGVLLCVGGGLCLWTEFRALPATPRPQRAAGPVSAAPPAGWYADPSGTAAQRYWDGSAWTEHVQGGDAQPAPARH